MLNLIAGTGPLSPKHINLLTRTLQLVDERADGFTAYKVWGGLIHDQELQRRAAAQPRTGRFPSVVTEEAYFSALTQMTPTERRALCARVRSALGVKDAI